MASAFDDLLRSVRRGEATAEDAAGTLYDELSEAETLSLLDGDADFEQGSLEMSAGYNTKPIVAGALPRLGVPGIRFTDGPRGVVMGHSTCFPVPIARGASWDPELELEIGRAIGREARAQGANLFAGVCINLLRHPAWGRAQETYGEDPVLLGQFGAALTQGVREQVMACVKHYALNSIENSRLFVDVQVDEEALHEVYLPHFKAVVDVGVDAVMSAYNKVNGTWAGHSSALLTEILRDEWGFAGFVMCDFISGIRDGLASLEAGMDLEMPFRNLRARQLPAALAHGRVDGSMIRRAGARILATQLRHLVSLREGVPAETAVASDTHRALARRAAANGMVLLRNQPVGVAPLLPLDITTLTSIAVLGSLADTANIGDLGSSAVRPPSTVSPLAGIRACLPPGVGIATDDGRDLDRAAAVATSAEVVVVVVGLTAEDEGEGHDRSSLALRLHDEQLIRAIAAANARTIVVIVSGGPVVMETWKELVPAVLFVWYPGMEGGHALADVLTGATEPGGRLPAVIPTDPVHLPAFDNQADRVTYDRWWGQRKLDRDGHAAAYPLGFGLSYTNFALTNLAVESIDEGERGGLAGSLSARVTVQNTGNRDGSTVVQLYGVRDPSPSQDRPGRELLGFRRVRLAAGERAEVDVRGSLQPLARRDRIKRVWSVVPGAYRFEAGQFWGDPAALTTVSSLGKR
jgi:beta-glucosidase